LLNLSKVLVIRLVFPLQYDTT